MENSSPSLIRESANLLPAMVTDGKGSHEAKESIGHAGKIVCFREHSLLPLITSAIHKKQCGRNDKELLPAVEKCCRVLNGPLTRRFLALIREENEITMLMMDQPVCTVPGRYLPAWNAIHP